MNIIKIINISKIGPLNYNQWKYQGKYLPVVNIHNTEVL
jgi:hypothetical protein